MIRSVTIFFCSLMAHNIIKSDCHYLLMHLARPLGLFNEKCWLINNSIFIAGFLFYSLDGRTVPALRLQSCLFITSSFSFCFLMFVCLCFSHFSVFLFLDLFVSRPEGTFLTGVALVETSTNKDRDRDRLCHIMQELLSLL